MGLSHDDNLQGSGVPPKISAMIPLLLPAGDALLLVWLAALLGLDHGGAPCF